MEITSKSYLSPLQIVRKIANFTKGEADNVRKAFAKKIQTMIPKLRKLFLKGTKECNIPEEKAVAIWEKMEKFGKYAFNKSHGGGYAYISIKTGWLSCHYPLEYMCANLNSVIDKSPEVKKLLAFAKKKKINILPPDVNLSEEKFSIQGNSIRFGLAGIKNVGKFSKYVIEEREKNGPYKSFQDFVSRTIEKANSKAYESLIFTSALDNFEGSRRSKVYILDKLMKFAKNDLKKRSSGQLTIFDLADTLVMNEEDKENLLSCNKINTPNLVEYDKKYIFAKEKELAGLYINEHPVDEYRKEIDKSEREFILDLKEATSFKTNDFVDGEESISEDSKIYNYLNKKVKVLGVVDKLTTRITKNKGERMLTFEVEDNEGEVNCVMFPRETMEYGHLVEDNKVIVLEGVITLNDFGLQLQVKRVVDVSQMLKVKNPKQIILTGSNNVVYAREQYKKALELSKEKTGSIPIIFIQNGRKFLLPKGINCNIVTIYSLQSIVGENNCKFVYE